MISLVLIVGFYRMPINTLFWTEGVEGERKTAAFLQPVIKADFLVPTTG